MRCLLIIFSLTIAAFAVSSCAPPPARDGGFNSPDPASKLYAIRRAGREQDRSKIPDLIQQLNSDDAAVRMFAIQALEKIDGTRRGYDPYASAGLRAEAIRAWLESYPPDPPEQNAPQTEVSGS